MNYRSEFESHFTIVKNSDVIDEDDLEEITSVFDNILNDVEKEVNKILEQLNVGDFDGAVERVERLSNDLF